MNTNPYGTKYFERYAMLSLAACVNKSWNSLQWGYGVESPDLQAHDLSIGIEVTRAISNEEGLAHRTIQQYFTDYASAKQIETEEWLASSLAYPNFTGEIVIADDIAMIIAVEGIYDIKIHLQNLQNAIETKTAKLNNNYAIFDTNGLYIFTFNPALDENEIIRAFQKAQGNIAAYPLQYDLFFINCVDTLYVLDMQTQAIDKIHLDADLVQELKIQALYQ